MPAAARKAETENAENQAQDDYDIMRNHFRVVLEGTNINATSLLTSDYINHFSSIMMLIEMLPIAPDDFMEEIQAWRPLSYKEHLEQSGFREKDLAIAAYDHAPRTIRSAFDHVVKSLQELSIHLISGVRNAMEIGQRDDIARLSMEGVPQLRELIDQAAAIVNGETNMHVGAINPAEPKTEDDSAAQAMVDELFD